jgi:3-hydroxybutyryl-CoA dehydrogenase
MIQTICICGAGTMGIGIAQVAARHGFPTLLFDVDLDKLESAKSEIERNVHFLEQKNKISGAEKKDLLEKIIYTHKPEDCRADIVIEAIVENMASKTALFCKLAEFNSPVTIFASNTSSLSIREIAAGIPDPERVVGMHFFNPATTMKLVEVVSTPMTSERTRELVLDLAAKMNKIAVQCLDEPGFIVNRVARPYYLESLWILDQYRMTVELIDELAESCGFKMGPFRLMDLIGNDINYAVSKSLYDALGKPDRLMPSPIQQMKVTNGELGKKTRRGYYQYSE